MWDEDGDTCKIWLTFLALKDERGVVTQNVTGIARVSKIGLDKVKEAIHKFEQADAQSSSKVHEGRRLVPTEDGWLVVNHEKYLQLGWSPEKREYERQRKAKYRAGLKEKIEQHQSGTDPKPPRKVGHEFCAAPTWEMCLKYRLELNKNGGDYTEKELRGAFLEFEAGGWMWGKGPVVQWPAAMESRMQNNRLKVNNHGNSGTGVGRARTDANQGNLNDGKSARYSGMGRKHIEPVPDVSGQGTGWNAESGGSVSGGVAPGG